MKKIEHNSLCETESYKGMTDNEIIKALRLHQQTGVNSCDECPYKGKMCNIILTRDALDLINRQKAEIEMLQKAIKVQDIMIEQQDYKLKQAKSEAIKEFAKRVKKVIIDELVVDFGLVQQQAYA